MSTLPSDEFARLGELLGGTRTIEEMLRRIGAPNRDTATQEPQITGDVPRILVWTRISEHFAVVAYSWPDGKFNIGIHPLKEWQS
jgi:hypothetical protein